MSNTKITTIGLFGGLKIAERLSITEDTKKKLQLEGKEGEMQQGQDPPTWVGKLKQKITTTGKVFLLHEKGSGGSHQLPSLEVLKQKDELPEALDLNNQWA